MTTNLKGVTYEGEWVGDKLDGEGINIAPNGNVYEGYFREGKPHGFGKLCFNGNTYEGDFKQGNMTGRGILKTQDGSVYEGGILNSKAEGFGALRRPDG